MKPIYPILIFLALIAAGCAPATQISPPVGATTGQATPSSPTPSEVQQPTEIYPAPALGEQATQGYPSPDTNQPPMAAYPYPANTATGINIVDKVIAAALSNNYQGLVDLIHYTSAKCTKAEGLGGPPKCLNNEAEGTPVDVLPLMGPEGSFVRKTDMKPDFFQGQYQLLAVYKVKPDANPDANYPPGTYGILLARVGQAGYQSLRVDDQGIVRIDTETGILGKDFPKADEFILQIKTQQ